MGNTFRLIFGAFWGHVLERDLLRGATARVREVGIESPTKHVAIVSSFQNQSQDRLQVDGTIRRRRSLGSARSKFSSPSFGPADLVGLGGPDPTTATTASE